jgi:hypothetical protein
MKRLAPLTTAILAAALVGCAATPRAYNPEESRALNLARAGGIYDMDLRDSGDGTRSYSKGMLEPLLDLASLATSFDAPLRHLSGSQTFLFNATDIMMTLDNPSARPSLMGWMPASMATSEAQAYDSMVTVQVVTGGDPDRMIGFASGSFLVSQLIEVIEEAGRQLGPIIQSMS